MNLIVEVKIKNIYGEDRIYPVNHMALEFIKLIGKKTFSNANISTIKQMGYEIVVAPTRF